MNNRYRRVLRGFALISIITALAACDSDDEPRNQAPTANAGADQSVDEQTAVTLNGSGTDTDGGIASYAWVQTSGTTVSLQNANAATANFTAPAISTDESLEFELTVTDNDGANNTDSLTVSITANLAPTADAGANQNVDEKTTVTLSGSGSDTDGSIASYTWAQTSGTTVSLQNANTATATFTAPDVNTNSSVTFELTVTDDDGDNATSSVTVVIIANLAPTANAGADQSADEQTTVTLSGSGSDTDGSIASYAWAQTSGTTVSLQNANTATASFTAPDINTDEGFTFELTVTDNDGDNATNSVTVTVIANLAPTANAGVDQSADEQTAVTLSGSGSDTDGNIASYLWVQTSGTSASLQNADTATASFTAPDISADENLVFKLTVTDDDGDTGADNVTIAITANPVLNGIVADGYLAGADVCLDTDGDNSCVGEATITQTDADGKFTIEASEEDFAKYPVVSEVVEGVTTDADRITATNPTGIIPTGEGYTLSSPPGVVDENGDPFISPLTTLAENERQRILKNNPAATDATATALVKVAEKLGISAADAATALTADFVADAQSTDPTVAKQAEQLHVVAQVTAGLLADTKTEIEAAINAGDLSDTDNADAILAALDRVSEQLDEVNAQVETLLTTLASQTFATTEEREAALDTAIENTVNANDVVEAATINDVVDVDNAPTDALTAAAMLQLDGGVWFTFLEERYNQESDQEEAVIEVDNIAYITETDTSIDDFFIFNPASGQLDPDNDDGTFISLTESGWAELTGADEHFTWQPNEDGSVIGRSAKESVTLDTSVTAIDLSGQSMAAVMALYTSDDDFNWQDILADDTVFTNDTTAYLLNGEDSGHHEIHDLSNNIFGSEHFVEVNNSPADNPTSLDQLVSNVDISIDQGIINSDAIYYAVGRKNNSGNHIIALFAHLFEGVVTYFSFDTQAPGLYSTLATTTFSTITLNGEDILQFDIPAELNDYRLFRRDDEDTHVNLSVYEGFVRYVDINKAESFNEAAFNETAKDDLLAAVDTDKLALIAELPENLKALADVSVAAYPDQKMLYQAAKILPDLWVLLAINLNSDGEPILSLEIPEVLTGAPFPLIQKFLGNYSYLLNKRVVTLKLLEFSLYDQADNFLGGPNPPSPQNQIRTFNYISAIDSSGTHTIYTLCARNADVIDAGNLLCDENTGQGYMSTDKATMEALILELNNPTDTAPTSFEVAFDQSKFIGKTVYTIYDENDGGGVSANGWHVDELSFNTDGSLSRSSDFDVSNVNIQYEFLNNSSIIHLTGSQTVNGENQTVNAFVVFRGYAQDEDVYEVCWLDEAETGVSSVDEAISQAPNRCNNGGGELIAFDRSFADAIAAAEGGVPATFSVFEAGFDQSQFIGNTVYDVYDDNDDGQGDASDWHIDELTFNSDGSLSINAQTAVSDVDVQYEFLNDSTVIHFTGTLTEDGATQTVNTFVVAVAYYEADNVYGACWKDERDGGTTITTADEAIRECAGTNGFEDPLLFDRVQAEAIAVAEGFTPSE